MSAPDGLSSSAPRVNRRIRNAGLVLIGLGVALVPYLATSRAISDVTFDGNPDDGFSWSESGPVREVRLDVRQPALLAAVGAGLVVYGVMRRSA